MVLRSLREVTEEFEKLKLETEMLENQMLKEEICSSCFYKHMREQDVQLEIVINIILSISRREVQEEFQKIKLEIEMTKNKMSKGKFCPSCYCKQLSEEIVKLKILVSIILSMFII
ncbi:hypothetical protein RDI58_026355 [Solanum bulbocastanum]|uniref:Uncharacterized protein n=1 Tax=Solanum bulbocastanum TaxID=147425 RepID=A0AAN8SWR1_SOLBU